MSFSALVAYFRVSPRRAFAFDGVGALVSALALGGLLPHIAPLVGADVSALRLLGGIALGYAAYDLACFATQPVRWRPALRVTAAANAAYPVISVAVLASDGPALRPLGHLYFAVEFAIVWSLAALQLAVASRRSG
jgi:hypothetical protein